MIDVTNQHTGMHISAKDILDAYLSKMNSIEGRVGAIETRVENSINTLNADIRQDAEFDNDNFQELRGDIKTLKKDLTDLTALVSGAIHSIELDGKDIDAEQNIKLKELEIRMLGIGAGSGTITTMLIQVIIELAKNIHIG